MEDERTVLGTECSEHGSDIPVERIAFRHLLEYGVGYNRMLAYLFTIPTLAQEEFRVQ
jgi:hypothetical protein